MKRPKNKRKAYFNKYYQEKIKPFRKWKQPTIWHQCVFCGMITKKDRFEAPESKFVIKTFKRWGNRFEIYVNENDFLKYMKLVGRRALHFLQICVIRGLISREEIATTFDLFTDHKTETITPIDVISEAETYSPINLSQRKTHSLNKLNKTFEIVKPAEAITIARTK
ncbi:unnamed protein product [marine sediment metagenome]|uniref:Uncharacterized protein n=1 Tax=marine sediment metagenome TaxID=412755 RepID=X1QG52_9ZZZZ